MNPSRRRILKGVLNGTAVTVALPFLECFLNGNGTALANGAPLPIRFGTWFWGLGMNKNIWIPKKVGVEYDLPEQIASFKDIKQHVNLFSNFNCLTDGRPNLCHYTGWVATRSGEAPTGAGNLPGQSLDVTVSEAIGGTTRFRSIQLAATGNPRTSFSYRSADAINPTEISAVDIYTKIFGQEFQDPNAPTFTPDAKTMVRKSVLSAVLDESKSLEAGIGAGDKARLDQYFTSVRELEGRVAKQLEKPPAAPNCRVPTAKPEEVQKGVDVRFVEERHKAMTDLMVMALACNQTKVFNLIYSNSSSLLTREGLDSVHHNITHEELLDEKAGYQVQSSWFLREAMKNFAYFVQAMAAQPEGAGSLLDHSLIYAHSDNEFAKTHNLDGAPMFTVGTANGRIKTGFHIDGKGDVATRLGYTLQRLMGLPIGEWGQGSLRTSREIGEILV